jgi:hypothetical protein
LLEEENHKLKKPELELLLSWHGIAKWHQPKGNKVKKEKWKELSTLLLEMDRLDSYLCVVLCTAPR